MKREGLTTSQARTVYDRLAPVYPLVERFESHAKAKALDLLDLAGEHRVLDVGTGPGGELRTLRHRAPQATIVGLDLSWKMVERARPAPPLLVQGDATHLPFADEVFDRLLCAYTLDLLPPAQVAQALAEFRRVLKVGGRAVLVTMTEGISPASRLFIAAWKSLYAVNPALCAGCRPLRLAHSAAQVGFHVMHQQVIVMLGFPSEILVVERAT